MEADSTIVFDTSSGISLEEQQEILAGINAMTGGTRLVPEAAVTKAKKKGFLFPLFVNIGALAILAAGFVLLSFFFRQDQQEIKGASAGMGLTEQILFQELREETSLAIEELTRLNNEREQIARIEDMIYGFFRTVNEHILDDRLEEAADLLFTMREFLGSPQISDLSTLQTRKERYLTTIGALERTISETLRARDPAQGLRIAELEQALDAFSDPNSDESRQIARLTPDFIQMESRANAAENDRNNYQNTVVPGLNNQISTLRGQINEIIPEAIDRAIDSDEDILSLVQNPVLGPALMPAIENLKVILREAISQAAGQ